MKKFNLLPLYASIFIIGCGPTEKQINEEAVITCNILKETELMTPSMRIREINKAREEMKKDKFLLDDNAILESIRYGLCTELVTDDPVYSQNLSLLKEQEKVAQEKKDEEERLAKEKKDEEERLAKLKKEEEQRLAKIKREEDRKLQKLLELERKKYEENVKAEKQKKWRDVIEAYLQEIDYSPKFLIPEFRKDMEWLTFFHTCNSNTKGIVTEIEIKLGGDLGILKPYKNTTGNCGFDSKTDYLMQTYNISNIIDELHTYGTALHLIDEVVLRVVGVYRGGFYDNRALGRKLDPETYGLRYGEDLDDPFEYIIFKSSSYEFNRNKTTAELNTMFDSLTSDQIAKFGRVKPPRKFRKNKIPASISLVYSINSKGKPINIKILNVWCGTEDQLLCEEYGNQTINALSKSKISYKEGDENRKFRYSHIQAY